MLINMAMLMIPKILQGSLPFQHPLDNKGRLHRLNMLQVDEKNGLILPTGQRNAPSAVINDAWYCMVLHGIAWYCMVVHGIAWNCIIL